MLRWYGDGEKMELCSYACEKFVYNHMCHENFDFEFIEPQTHSEFELIFVKSGELNYIIEDRIYNVGENDMIFTKPGMLHRINFLSREKYDRYDILFKADIIFPGVFDKIPEDIDVFYIKKTKRIEEIFKKMDFYCENFTGSALENILTHSIDEIFYNILLSKEYTNERFYTSNALVTKAIHYIEENLENDLSLENICEELFITKSYLNKLFNRYLRVTPAKYITSKRLIAIQKEIISGEIPTKVFHKFGFLEYSTFYRNYKEYFGYPPSEENKIVIEKRIEI